MNSVIGHLKPENLWKHFERILGIPRCSGNERAAGDYIISVAEAAGLEWSRDKVGNIVVRKPASPGRESEEGLILQGHLDMVCEKNSDKIHDFSKDAIDPEIKGEWVYAKGTTLGADNGIGLAASLAVMEDKSMTHGPLEFLFTVDEETGLTGAYRLSSKFLKGKYLLNLDSEDEGTFTIGCAGGADTEISFPLERKKSASKNLFNVMLTGFLGGHSGIDIDQGRANAIKLLARLLLEASAVADFDLVSLDGGSKRNAIPREAWAVVACAPEKTAALGKAFKKSFDKIKAEYKYIEKQSSLVFKRLANEKATPMTKASRNTLLRLLIGLPHGVVAMHPEIKQLVETSSNLAIVKTDAKQVEIVCNTRSSVASALEATRLTIKSLAELAGAAASLKIGYPSWTPDLEAGLLKKIKEIYSKMFSVEPGVVAIHAGLECGIIGEKYPGMEMISFGPTLKSPHSPDERVHIGSVEKFWRFLCGCVTGI